MTYYRKATAQDIPYLLKLELRTSDKQEVWASTGLPVPEALLNSIASSDHLWVVIHKEKIEAVFGVASAHDVPGVGIPWFLATDRFSEFSLTFAKESRKVIKDIHEHYPLLLNRVDSRHTDSIRWLRWLGFDIDEESPHILCDPDVPFYLFVKFRKEE